MAVKNVSHRYFLVNRGALAWIKYPTKDMDSDLFLLPLGVMGDQASRTKEKGSKSQEIPIRVPNTFKYHSHQFIETFYTVGTD